MFCLCSLFTGSIVLAAPQPGLVQPNSPWDGHHGGVPPDQNYPYFPQNHQPQPIPYQPTINIQNITGNVNIGGGGGQNQHQQPENPVLNAIIRSSHQQQQPSHQRKNQTIKWGSCSKWNGLKWSVGVAAALVLTLLLFTFVHYGLHALGISHHVDDDHHDDDHHEESPLKVHEDKAGHHDKAIKIPDRMSHHRRIDDIRHHQKNKNGGSKPRVKIWDKIKNFGPRWSNKKDAPS